MSLKSRKNRGCRYHGRGHKSHKSGSKGGVGRAGIWSHNKNARKFKVFETKSKPSWLSTNNFLSLIKNEIERFDSSKMVDSILSLNKIKSDYTIIKENNNFELVVNLNHKFYKIIGNANTEVLDNFPNSKILINQYSKKHFKKITLIPKYEILIENSKISKKLLNELN